MSTQIETKDILARIIYVLKLENDIELSKYLGVAEGTLRTWRARNKIPYEECFIVSKRNNISLDWLLTGEGPMYHQPFPSSSENDFNLLLEWLKKWWKQADEKERAWLEVQMKKCFPEFKEWLEQQK